MTTLDFSGRLLFLTEDPDRVHAQLSGQDLSRADAGPLRNEVSTDEIVPVPKMTFHDERLGSYALTGFKSGGRSPIGKDAVKNAGVTVIVAGGRYGKGSSREHAPFSERHAGVRLVVAESFERIYRQNADNIGLFTSTDFGLIARIRAGEPIPLDELLRPRDRLTAAILRSGGLLAYGRAHAFDDVPAPGDGSAAGAMTYAEKIVRRHRIVTADTDGPLEPGAGIFVRPDWRYVIDMYTGMATHMLHRAFGERIPLRNPGSIVAFEDHLSYAHRSAAFQTGVLGDFSGLSNTHRDFVKTYGLRSHGVLDGSEGSQGICHPMMTERYALPGQLIAATDSHTPHSGSVGSLAFGVGTTDIANAFVTDAVRMTMPKSLLVRLDGALRPGVSSKDLVLHLLALPEVRAGACVGKLVEFAGPALAALSTDERATLTNMTAELGGFTGLVAPDAETVRFLKERRGVDLVLEDWMRSDPGAVFDHTIAVDCSSIPTMVAAPGDPGNGRPIDAIADRPHVDIAYGGSCTGGKRADFDQYHAVLAWAAEHGLAVAGGTVLYLQFGTVGVRDWCAERGYLATFERVGAQLLMPSCGACANLGPGGSTRAEQVTVSAQNRNFPGRSGPGQLWVASPATVAASAIAGRLCAFDELVAQVAAGGAVGRGPSASP
ncbi:MAG: aconitase family protein [Burkholderiaceae bacterium]